MHDPILNLIEMSRSYGSDARYVLAGGGNTSYKDGKTLRVKASGCALAELDATRLVALDMGKLDALTRKEYPKEFDAREAAALADLMGARLAGEKGRPSVETLLHAILPFPYVCHLHPALVNAMTCGLRGEELARRLFPGALWVPAIMPGYVLAMAMKAALDDAHAKGAAPRVIFLQNHGVFVGGEDIAQIDEAYAAIMAALGDAFPETKVSPAGVDEERAAKIAPALRMMLWDKASFVRFIPLAFPDAPAMPRLTLTPDHMVYCGAQACFVPSAPGDGTEALCGALSSAVGAFPGLPRIVSVAGVGTFACGSTLRECDAAYALFLDAARITRLAEAVGGARPLPPDLAEAIAGWEVERYRKGQVLDAGGRRRAMDDIGGSIALVTGGAQGFGRGIAEGLAEAGAAVVLADLNREGAAAAAADIESTQGPGAALAAAGDVGDASAVAGMVRAAVLRYGGLDILISNAGIVRAGGLDELSLEAFDLSTRVNYTAFFLCAREAARVMRLQHSLRPGHTSNIIQINSKSGLAGSNRNFAYAGAKFGGIGLVQSFALELAPQGIKVNAVCPGNFLDGPLWSDPENGLFIQYLRAGKVPGAKTVEDVKRAYEAKVPLGRGCRVGDVVRAILYIIAQEYETGQALPVTGGQEMLR